MPLRLQKYLLHVESVAYAGFFQGGCFDIGWHHLCDPAKKQSDLTGDDDGSGYAPAAASKFF